MEIEMKLKLIIASFLALTNFAACGGDKATNSKPKVKQSPKAAKAAKAKKKKK